MWNSKEKQEEVRQRGRNARVSQWREFNEARAMSLRQR